MLERSCLPEIGAFLLNPWVPARPLYPVLSFSEELLNNDNPFVWKSYLNSLGEPFDWWPSSKSDSLDPRALKHLGHLQSLAMIWSKHLRQICSPNKSGCHFKQMKGGLPVGYNCMDAGQFWGQWTPFCTWNRKNRWLRIANVLRRRLRKSTFGIGPAFASQVTHLEGKSWCKVFLSLISVNCKWWLVNLTLIF